MIAYKSSDVKLSWTDNETGDAAMAKVCGYIKEGNGKNVPRSFSHLHFVHTDLSVGQMSKTNPMASMERTNLTLNRCGSHNRTLSRCNQPESRERNDKPISTNTRQRKRDVRCCWSLIIASSKRWVAVIQKPQSITW